MTPSPTGPTVSVAVPVHNGAHWLADAARSVLGQTFSDLELLIVDTASTDATEAVSRDLAATDPRVRYERSEAYRGLTENHLAALALARGRYFCWLAADDAMRPELLERCVAELERDAGLALVVPSSARIDSDWTFERPTPIDERYRDDTLDWNQPRGWRRFVNAIRQLHECNAFSGVFRIEALRAVPLGPYPGSDRVLLAEVVLAARAVQLRDRLQLRRLHPDQISRTLTSHRADRLFNRPLPRRAHVETLNLFFAHLAAIRRSPAPLADRVLSVGAMLTVWWAVRRFYVRRELAGLRRLLGRP